MSGQHRLVSAAVADRLFASAGPLCVSRGQEQDGSEALEIEQRLLGAAAIIVVLKR